MINLDGASFKLNQGVSEDTEPLEPGWLMLAMRSERIHAEGRRRRLRKRDVARGRHSPRAGPLV